MTTFIEYCKVADDSEYNLSVSGDSGSPFQGFMNDAEQRGMFPAEDVADEDDDYIVYRGTLCNLEEVTSYLVEMSKVYPQLSFELTTWDGDNRTACQQNIWDCGQGNSVRLWDEDDWEAFDEYWF